MVAFSAFAPQIPSAASATIFREVSVAISHKLPRAQTILS